MNEDLRQEIIELETLLNQKKKVLFENRLIYISESMTNISNIEIFTDLNKHSWQITYTHTTDKYSNDHYLMESEQSGEIEYITKTTKISFGKSKKYYLNNDNIHKFDIYRNSANKLRVVNVDYALELNGEEQRMLIDSYVINKNIPEWFAISILLHISDNNWTDDSMVLHLGLV